MFGGKALWSKTSALKPNQEHNHNRAQPEQNVIWLKRVSPCLTLIKWFQALDKSCMLSHATYRYEVFLRLAQVTWFPVLGLLHASVQFPIGFLPYSRFRRVWHGFTSDKKMQKKNNLLSFSWKVSCSFCSLSWPWAGVEESWVLVELALFLPLQTCLALYTPACTTSIQPKK